MPRPTSHDSPRRVFGQNVRARRLDLKLSQEKLADAAGVDRTYVGSVERGERNLSLQNIVKLATALQVEPADLLHGIGNATERTP